MMTSTLSPSTESESCDTSLTIAYLSAPVIFFISLALGCTLSRDDVHAVAHQKRAVLIGWVSQFGFMPLITYAIARIFDYNALLAIGCILCGCAPGGTTSNVFTYWSRGNVALSIVMSIASTVCAFFMVPLCILIYVESTVSGCSPHQLYSISRLSTHGRLFFAVQPFIALRHHTIAVHHNRARLSRLFCCNVCTLWGTL
eukprot:m.231156 g.231156  ORF g.231156 m.231156 type:complete len:200 (-) comp19265_c0_seq2:1148-1747(-)